MEDWLLGVVAAGLGGFVAWMLTKIIGHLVMRRRLIVYLATSLNSHISSLHANEPWLDAVREKTIKENHTIETAAEYTVGEVDYLERVTELALRHLTKRELSQLAKCAAAIWEVEHLFDGLCSSISIIKEKKILLTPPLVAHLNAKINRIKSYLRVLPRNVESLSGLPEDYRDVLPPETLVGEDSAKPSAANPQTFGGGG